MCLTGLISPPKKDPKGKRAHLQLLSFTLWEFVDELVGGGINEPVMGSGFYSVIMRLLLLIQLCCSCTANVVIFVDDTCECERVCV